jgi:hypothetical protein
MGQGIKQLYKLGELPITHHATNMSAIIPTCFHAAFLHKALTLFSLLRLSSHLDVVHCRSYTHTPTHTHTHTQCPDN